MRQVLLSAVIGLVVAGAALAGDRGSRGHRDNDRHERHDDRDYRRDHDRHERHEYDRDYHLHHGTKFEHGWFYKGKEHDHWSERCYNERYGCETFYCPCTLCWYYFCVPDCCYYPVSYCPYGKFRF